MTMTVLGVPQLLARFAKAAALGEVAQHAGSAALAEEVATDARAIVPVDTGTLRDSIHTEPGKVVVTAPYAAFVEYGTADTSAQPYLRPAADTANDEHALGVAAAVMRTA